MEQSGLTADRDGNIFIDLGRHVSLRWCSGAGTGGGNVISVGVC